MVQTHLREPPKLEYGLCAFEQDGFQPTQVELASADTKKKLKVTVINGQCIKMIVDGRARRLHDVLQQLDYADGELYTAPLTQCAVTGVAATIWKKVLDSEYKLSKNNRTTANFKHFLRDWVSALCKQKYPADVMARWILQGKCKIGKHDPFQKPSDWRTLFDANFTRITENEFLARLEPPLSDVKRREAIYMNLRDAWQIKVDGSPTIDIYNDDMDDLYASLDALWQQDKEDGILDSIARQREADKIRLEADRKRKLDAAVDKASKKPKDSQRGPHQSGPHNRQGPNKYRGPGNYNKPGSGYHSNNKGYHNSSGYHKSGYQGQGYNSKYRAPSSNHGGGGNNNGPHKDNRGRGNGNGNRGRGNLHAHYADDRDDRQDDDRQRSRSPSKSGRHSDRSPSHDRYDDFDSDRADNYAVDYDARDGRRRSRSPDERKRAAHRRSRSRSRSPDERKRSDRRRPHSKRHQKKDGRERDSSPRKSRRNNWRDYDRSDGYNYDRDAYDMFE